MIAVCEVPKLHLDIYQRDVIYGMTSRHKLPVGVVSKSFLELVKVAQKLEGTVQLVVGQSFR